jgi:signal transduction histidine kinase
VYGIVRQSRGYVDVTSTPGIGTTFRIGWPQFEDA